jgi:hypothetical protein
MDEPTTIASGGVPPLSTSLARAVEIAQQLAADELRLLQVESHEQLQAWLARGAWLVAGALCALLAWVALLAAIVVALDGRFSLEARLGGLAASQALLGAAMVAVGLRRRGAR